MLTPAGDEPHCDDKGCRFEFAATVKWKVLGGSTLMCPPMPLGAFKKALLDSFQGTSPKCP